MATGHYARLSHENENIQLLRAIDDFKDQSYVLHVLGQNQLHQALFPLGDYTKIQVRQMARDFGLPVAERSESQDLCFLGADDYRTFLKRQRVILSDPGTIRHKDGTELGLHQGLAFYTIGQRKGLGIASPRPLYVLEKDISNNLLIVGEEEYLGKNELTAVNVNWVSGNAPRSALRLEVKIRYKAAYTWALVTPQSESQVHVRFEQHLRDITPGQAAVFYDGPVCLGGGIIQS
jgi:tRNA-specific 2-thiouridylase